MCIAVDDPVLLFFTTTHYFIFTRKGKVTKIVEN